MVSLFLVVPKACYQRIHLNSTTLSTTSSPIIYLPRAAPCPPPFNLVKLDLWYKDGAFKWRRWRRLRSERDERGPGCRPTLAWFSCGRVVEMRVGVHQCGAAQPVTHRCPSVSPSPSPFPSDAPASNHSAPSWSLFLQTYLENASATSSDALLGELISTGCTSVSAVVCVLPQDRCPWRIFVLYVATQQPRVPF